MARCRGRVSAGSRRRWVGCGVLGRRMRSLLGLVDRLLQAVRGLGRRAGDKRTEHVEMMLQVSPYGSVDIAPLELGERVQVRLQRCLRSGPIAIADGGVCLAQSLVELLGKPVLARSAMGWKGE